MMSGAAIPVANEEDLKKLLEQVAKGSKLIVTKFGVVNSASIDSIVEDKERTAGLYFKMRNGDGTGGGIETDEAAAGVKFLGNSPFAKLLSEEMKMIQ